MADMGAPEGKKEVQVNIALNHLEGAIQGLTERTEMLCKRTDMVRRNEPVAVNEAKPGLGPSSVPLVQRIDEFTSRINSIRSTVNVTLDQLEI